MQDSGSGILAPSDLLTAHSSRSKDATLVVGKLIINSGIKDATMELSQSKV